MEVLTRLVWKELRTQAQLWLAMLIGVFLLSMSVTTASRRPESMSDLLIGFVYVLTAGFAAASAAVLFAGESEEGQADWLRQLPMNTSQLVAGKAGFGVLATGLLLLASYVVAALCARWRGFTLQPQFVPAASSMLCIAGCFVWGVLYSALFSRVLAAIVAAAVTTLLAQVVLNQVFHDVVICDVAHACLLLVISLINCALLVRWHRNEIVRRRVFLVAPTTRNSLGALPLKWLVTTGPLEVRRWTVLLWKEVRVALPMVAVTFAALMVAGGMTDGIAPIVLVPAVIVLFGLRTFRSEHRENVISFLSDRGIPGTRVWLIKVAVWMSAAAVAVGGFLVFEQVLIAFGQIRRTPDRSIPGFLAEWIPYAHLDRTLLDHSNRMSRERDLEWTGWSLGIGLFVGLFAIAQMASFWMRRAILAFAAAFVGGVLFIVWALNMTSFDIRPSVSIWPAAILFLAAVWSTRQIWMEETTGWAVRRRQLLWGVFPTVLTIGLTILSRGWQVPEKQPGFDPVQYTSALDSLDQQWTNRWRSVATTRSAESLPKLVEDATLGHRIDPLMMDSVTGNERAIPVRTLVERLNSNIPRVPPALPGVLQSATFKRQFDRYKTSLKGTRYVASQTSSWADFEHCLDAERRVLTWIRGWSASEYQTVELLDNSLRWLSDRANGAGGISVADAFREMVKRRYVVLRGLYTGEGRIGNAIDYQLISSGHDTQWMIRSLLGTAERRRVLNLLAWATDADLKMPIVGFPALQKVENRPLNWASPDFDYQRYAQTTPLLPPELRDGAAVETSNVQGVSNEQIAMLRVQHSLAITIVAVALQRHRLVHGEFPGSLAEMIDCPVAIPVDPIAEAPFLYTRCDDDEKAFRTVGRFIRGQPMLKAAGGQQQLANKAELAELNQWDLQMEIQPARVLVLAYGESPHATNDNWPRRPEPEISASMGMSAEEASGGMQAGPPNLEGGGEGMRAAPPRKEDDGGGMRAEPQSPPTPAKPIRMPIPDFDI